MNIIRGIENFDCPWSACALTIGNFDSVHLGHRALIHRVLAEAQKLKVASVVMTFDPHPMKVLRPQANLQSIFDVEDRIEQIQALGIEHLIIEPFSRNLSQLTPEEFFETLLIGKLHVAHLIVGYDFNFGRDRQGTLAVLQTLAATKHVPVTVVEPVSLDGATVSSTAIRQYLRQGRVHDAWHFLGRPFFLRGVVERGEGRGQKLGFATANLYTRAELFPANGVYVTATRRRGRLLPSVTNIGRNPTFAEQKKHPTLVETHILDFDEDIYGESIEVLFLKRLRDEIKFSSVESLVNAIKTDVRNTRDYTWETFFKSCT